jgi:hypothetical protein
VQHVKAEEQGNAEPRLPGELLGRRHVLRVVKIDERADAAVADVLGSIKGAVGSEAELPDLLIERHAGDELARPPLDLVRRERHCAHRHEEH